MNEKIHQLLKEGYSVEFQDVNVLGTVFFINVVLRKGFIHHGTTISENAFSDETQLVECLNMLRKEFLHDESRGYAGD